VNLNFLGDALDHWKGSLFKSLQDAGVVCGLAVDPMASDRKKWTKKDFELFAHLLRVSPSQIILHTADLEERPRYFAEIPHTGDLFLDPDTGVATGRVKNPKQYIMPVEIKQLLDTANDRMVMVYQHIRAQPVTTRVKSVLDAMQRDIGPFRWCSYESGTVAMIFIARRRKRTDSVEKHFCKLLGQHSDKRIRSGERSNKHL